MALNNLQCLICHKTKLNQIFLLIKFLFFCTFQIPELFASIRKATKEHRDDASDGSLFFHDVGESSEPAKAFCEVMYLGKVQVDNRKLTSTDIDRLANKICPQEDDGYLGMDKIDSRQRHASDASVRSLPASLDSTVVVTENDLEQQHKQLHGVKLNGVYESVEEFHGVESPGSSFENIEESSDMKIDMSKDFTDGDKDVNPEGKALGGSVVDLVNQTMLFRLGKDEVSLINLDQKKVILERKFSDISFVSQVKYLFLSACSFLISPFYFLTVLFKHFKKFFYFVNFLLFDFYIFIYFFVYLFNLIFFYFW